MHFADDAADTSINIDGDTRHSHPVNLAIELERVGLLARFIPQEFLVQSEREQSTRNALLAMHIRSDIQCQTFFHREIVRLRYTPLVSAIGSHDGSSYNSRAQSEKLSSVHVNSLPRISSGVWCDR